MFSLRQQIQAAYISKGKGAFRTTGSPIVNCGFMAAASLRRAGMSIPAMRRDKGRKLMQREVAVVQEEVVLVDQRERETRLSRTH